MAAACSTACMHGGAIDKHYTTLYSLAHHSEWRIWPHCQPSSYLCQLSIRPLSFFRPPHLFNTFPAKSTTTPIVLYSLRAYLSHGSRSQLRRGVEIILEISSKRLSQDQWFSACPAAAAAILRLHGTHCVD